MMIPIPPIVFTRKEYYGFFKFIFGHIFQGITYYIKANLFSNDLLFYI